MRKALILLSTVLLISNAFADELSNVIEQIDAYQTQLAETSFSLDKINPNEINAALSGRKVPHAMIYEHTDLYQWQLFSNFYFDYEVDTTNSVINVDVDYKPSDDYFSTVPANFYLESKRPYDFDNYQILMITVFQSLGTNITVLADEADTKYGDTGHHYCQSFLYSGTRMAIDAYFVEVDGVCCMLYYMTSESFYNNYLYSLFFNLILDGAIFNGSGGSIAKQASKPITFQLDQNYPNPFNNKTVIEYRIDSPSQVKLEIFDISGKQIDTLVNEYQSTGNYKINFDASKLASGIYLYRISNSNNFKTHQMLLVK